MTPTTTRETAEKLDLATTKLVETAKLKKARRIKSGMFDVPEIVALSLSGLCLFSVIMCYFFGLVPARADLKQREQTREQLATQLKQLQAKLGDSRSTESGVADLVGSVERFETNFLSLPTNGNASLYSRLNELIRSNNLRNTAGPDYVPLETIDLRRAGNQTENGGRTKLQSLFPGTAVNVTVEGSYANLRHFIKDLENSSQFVVINAVEIESNGDNGKVSTSQTTQNKQPSQSPTNNGFQNQPTMKIPPQQMMPSNFENIAPNNAPNNAQGQTVFPRQSDLVAPRTNTPNTPSTTTTTTTSKPRGSVVSLRLQLATYFRRTSQNN